MVLTLALGIGANGAVFTILQSVLLQPLPYDDPSRLALVSNPTRTNLPLEFSGPMAISVRDAAAGRFGEVAAAILTHNGGQLGAVQGDHLAAALDLSIGDRAVRLSGATVTPNFFRVLGVHAAIGRLFADGDGRDRRDLDHPQRCNLAPRVRRRLDDHRTRDHDRHGCAAHRPDIHGDRRASARSCTSAIPPKSRRGSMTPWSAVAQSNPYAVGQYTLVARVQPGVSIEHARQLIRSMPRNPLVAPADARGGELDRLDLVTMRDWIVGDTRPSLYLLGGVATLLLLVTCVTVSNGLARANLGASTGARSAIRTWRRAVAAAPAACLSRERC